MLIHVDCCSVCMFEVKAVGVAGLASLVVLSVVGRKSYQRKIVQLTKELEKQGKDASSLPPKVWAVLTPGETMKVFLVPLAVVVTGSTILGYGIKQWVGIRDVNHGLEMLKWITRTGPRPSSGSSSAS